VVYCFQGLDTLHPILQLDSGLTFEGTYEEVVGTDVVFPVETSAASSAATAPAKPLHLQPPFLVHRKLVFRQVTLTTRHKE
jgi:hypothetical protein